jgi:hypothetical protein
MGEIGWIMQQREGLETNTFYESPFTYFDSLVSETQVQTCGAGRERRREMNLGEMSVQHPCGL